NHRTRRRPGDPERGGALAEVAELVTWNLFTLPGEALDPQDAHQEPVQVPLDVSRQLDGGFPELQVPVPARPLQRQLAVELPVELGDLPTRYQVGRGTVRPDHVGVVYADLVEVGRVGVGEIA